MESATLLHRAGRLAVLLAPIASCAAPRPQPLLPELHDPFRRAAIEFLEEAAFSDSPTLRMHAIEAFKEVAPEEGMRRLAIPLNIENEYPGASFAALMAVGETQASVNDTLLDLIRTRAESPDKHVRMAALFALHRLGDARRTSELATFLLDDPDPKVRANAALLIGRLGGKHHARLLRRALRHERKTLPMLQILESLAILGDGHAITRLMQDGYSAVPEQSAIGLMMLANARRHEAEDIFRFKLSSGGEPEVRLQAARGLARLGYSDGRDLALRHLYFSAPRAGIRGDPPERQIERIRGLAALVLDNLGDPETLGNIKAAFEDPGQPQYVRVALARAAIRVIDGAGPSAGGPGAPRESPLEIAAGGRRMRSSERPD